MQKSLALSVAWQILMRDGGRLLVGIPAEEPSLTALGFATPEGDASQVCLTEEALDALLGAVADRRAYSKMTP